MKKLVWLASYPKSGNTWLRFLLSELLLGGVRSSHDIFDGTPVEPGLDAEALVGERTNVVKIHRLPDSNHPLERFAVGAVHLIRNPLKLMVSNLRHFLLLHGGLPEDRTERYQLVHAYVGDFIRAGGDMRWKAVGWGSWSEHTLRWMEPKPYPQLLVQYEDLLENPSEWVQKICDFAGLDYPRSQIDEAVSRWSFAGMRALEDDEIRRRHVGMFYKPHYEPALRQGIRFVGSHGSPIAKVELDPELEAEAKKAFEPAFSACGYQLKNEQAVST